VVSAVLGDDSGGPFYVYFPGTGTVVIGSLNAFISGATLNGDGSRMLVDGLYVVDTATGALLGTMQGGGGTGAVLLQSGPLGYDVEGTSLVTVNTATYLSGPSRPLPSNGGTLALSPNNAVMVATATDGALIIHP
jgi:hypothetical protein